MDMSARSLRRWKIATGVAVAACALLLLRGGPSSPARAGHVARSASFSRATDDAPPAVMRRLRADLRSRSDEDALLRELAATTDPTRLGYLCQELGFVGSAKAVPVLVDLVRDPRWSVGSAAIQALGRIGTPDAVAVLIDLSEDGPTWQVRRAMISLGDAGTPEAIARLTDAATGPDGPNRTDAIEALGTAGDGVLDTLKQIAASGNRELVDAVIDAAEKNGSDAARAFLRDLATSGDRDARIAALKVLRLDGDAEASAVLVAAVGGGDPATAAAAAVALGNARHRAAVPALIDLARTGGKEARSAAMEALANIGDDDAMAALGAIAAGTGADAQAAARTLSNRGDDASAAVLLDAIREQPGTRVELLRELQGLPGEDVDAYFLDLAQNGDGPARTIALNHLDQRRHPEMIALAIDATSGDRRSRNDAIALLASSHDPAAYAALLEMTKRDDAIGIEATDALVSRKNGRPEVTALLGQTLRGGRSDQVASAAAALADAGTPEGRAVLLDVLRGPDAGRAAAVAGVLLDAGGDPAMVDALAAVARTSREPAVRAKAIAELVEGGHELGASQARSLLLAGDHLLGSALIEDLKRQERPQASALLEIAARQSTSADVRGEAIDGLAQTANATTIDLFAELATDASAVIRDKALGGLAEIDTDESIEQMIALSRRDDPKELIYRLKWSTQRAAHAELARVIGGDDGELAVHAIQSLYQQSGTLDAALRGALGSQNHDVAVAAARRLREIGAALSPADLARVAALLD
jgi:HEAT repeat protein